MWVRSVKRIENVGFYKGRVLADSFIYFIFVYRGIVSTMFNRIKNIYLCSQVVVYE